VSPAPVHFPLTTLDSQLYGTCHYLTLSEKVLLDKNEFVGTLPASISKLSKLEVLELGDNYLTGLLPIEMAQLERLQGLSLKDNAVEGPFFEMFGSSWPDLKFLNLDGTQLTGTIPSDALNRPNLQLLSLISVAFHGPLPKLSAPALEFFYFAASEMTATLPDFSKLTSLST